MVKDFGDHLEQFTLEYYRRVQHCRLAIRDYTFRKAGLTRGTAKKKGGPRLSNTDIDVVALGDGRVYAISCQEQIPFQPKTADRNIKNIVANLEHAMQELQKATGNPKIVPVVACVSMSHVAYQRLSGKNIEVLFFLDMAAELARHWENMKTNNNARSRAAKESEAPEGFSDWLFSRLCRGMELDGCMSDMIASIRPRGRRSVYELWRKAQAAP